MNAEVSMLDVFLHTALKGAVVLAVALVVGVLLHKMAAARRYAVWITAVGALALLPPAMLLLPAWRVLPQTTARVTAWPDLQPEEIMESQEPGPLAAEAETAAAGASLNTPPSAQVPVPPTPSERIPWQEIASLLPIVWLTISTLLLLRLAWGATRLNRLESTLKPGTCELLAEVTHELGLKRAPYLLIGAENAVPMVWGVLKPRLLLPHGFESWIPVKLRGVLLHELAHLKRRDPLALWTAQWVKALHWFNPLAWLTIRQLRADQERACDDTVLRHGVRPSDYAQHLLDLSRHARLAPGLALCALTITRCAPVEARVKAILDSKRSRDGLTLRWLLGMTGLALLTTLPVAMLHAIEGPKLRGRILDRNGAVLAETTAKKIRNYPFKALAGHVTGYTRLPDEKHPQPWGGAAMEKMHEATLGEGKDLALSLDARIQSLVLRTMQDAGYKRGAAVVLDPRTGEILASVSLPVYDPNILIPAISQKDWDALLKDQDAPLLNRCVRAFAPGSAFIPFTALAGTSAGVRDRSFTCRGSVTYGSREFLCWKGLRDQTGHGTLDMKGAIVASCNCYWYQFGNAAGTDAFDKIGGLLGFGQGYALAEDEDKGILSTSSWMARIRPQEQWTPGHTANMAIGQGTMLASPVQMAVLAATVAQRGKVPQPTYLQLKKGESVAPRADLLAEGADSGQIDQIREGMRLVVNSPEGTGKAARSDKVVISGKTGTAQNWRRVGGMQVEDNHGWFIGFAPYDNPTLAFAILKSGAKSGGSDCAPLAKRIVEETLALSADGSGAVAPVDPPLPDAKAAGIIDEIGRAAVASGENFKLNELKAEDGKIVVTGEGLSVNQVLTFLDRLRKLGEPHAIQWLIPAPTIQNDNTATFRAVGTRLAQAASNSSKTKPSSDTDKDRRETMTRLMLQLKQTQDKIRELEKQIKAGASATLEQQHEALAQEKRKLLQSLGMVTSAARSKAIFTSKMPEKDQERWRHLRISEGFADMPAEAMMSVTTPEDRLPPTLVSEFRFAVAKDAAHRWLVASLSQKEQAELNWPAQGESFQRVLHTQKGCSIHVRYQAGGMVVVTVWKAKPLLAPDDASQGMRQTADAAARDTTRVTMRRVEAEQWRGLQVQGRLAPLPECAVVSEMSRRDTRWLQLEFFAPREAARRWLLDSLSERMRARQAAALLWPAAPEVFQRSYTAAGLCDITVQYGDADLIYVIISKQKLPILIAPDEATPPRPKTAAPSELDGVVSAEDQVPPKDPLYREQVPLTDWGKTPPLQLHWSSPASIPQERQMMKDAMAQRDRRNNFSKALLAAAPE